MSQYQERRRQLARVLTIYGRNPVKEALWDINLTPEKLHLADSNRATPELDAMEAQARKRGVEIVHHSRTELAYISKNGRQDQGVALDVACPAFRHFEDALADLPTSGEWLALDGVTNPQNLGMVVRSVTASPICGLLLPERGGARLDALVIKASAGTLFRAPIVRCDALAPALSALREAGASITGLEANGSVRLSALAPCARRVFVLGGESNGLSPAVRAELTETAHIAMGGGVESLNVAVTASLVALRGAL